MISMLLFFAAMTCAGAKSAEVRVYPRRTQEEAAVLEWGNSAIISALDCSVAQFGPQTSDSALLEVEAMPVLAKPVNGVQVDDEGNHLPTLLNADEIHGNMCVMTNTGSLSGLEMAKLAQDSGAVALLVVNIDENRPDDIYRLPRQDGDDAVDIPVAMISLNSANVLTTATVSGNARSEDIVNNGMPDRVRLYAGGDRPFFEDVEAQSPTIYLIHNLLTDDECDSLIDRAKSKVQPLSREDELQFTSQPNKFVNTQRAVLWQGMLQTPTWKAIEERIEQVTGFPGAHYSDWIVDRIDDGGHWDAHYDVFRREIPVASIVVHLGPHVDTVQGGDLLYESVRKGGPVQIRPKRGMAVVHHNTDDRHQMDKHAIRSMLTVSDGPIYVATKYIFATPLTNARRIALPVFALFGGGRLPTIVVLAHDMLVEKFGFDNGSMYFDKLCIFLPFLLVLGVVQFVVDRVNKKVSSNNKKNAASSKPNKTKKTQ